MDFYVPKLYSIEYSKSKDKKMTILECIKNILVDSNDLLSEPMEIPEMIELAKNSPWSAGNSAQYFWIFAIKKGISLGIINMIKNPKEKRLYLGHKYALNPKSF